MAISPSHVPVTSAPKAETETIKNRADIATTDIFIRIILFSFINGVNNSLFLRDLV
jgi:hypothetical protein